MEVEKQVINQNGLSRQLAVYGHQTQGCSSMGSPEYNAINTQIGVQVAKNLVLAGPKAVVLFDKTVVTSADLSRNFYCHSSNVGKSTRAQACLPQLKELNPNVHMSVSDTDSVEYIASNFDCVIVLDNYHKQYLIELNKACHAKNIGFLLAGNLGLYGYTFVDFGQNHRVFDATGQQGRTIHIAGITQEEEGLVCLHEDKKHGLTDNDCVLFKNVEGMTEINGKQYRIKVKSPQSFTIGDTRAFSPFLNGGIALEQKVPIFFKSFELEKSLRYPYPPESKEMPIANWDKFGVPEQLHVLLNAVYKFVEKHQTLPAPLSEEHANQLILLCKEHLSSKMEIEGEDFKVENVDEGLIRNVAKFAQCQISPCSSFWGGIITQQIVKFTGKYTPLRQWLHHQFFEVLPKDGVVSTMKDNDYSLMFGDEFVHKVASCSSFVVGAGALGCEFIKMFALMGVSTKGGRVTVTDDDNIEISNLNRQFLFRREHVGKNKSETACAVGRAMNPNAVFDSVKLRVGQESEQVFNDDFWTAQDFIVNAVDNVKARQYVDQQCVWYQKPLFESGTLGTKCHSQVIIPHATISYSDIIDPPEESIPLCTLKNFPYQIEHTIQWARDYFEGAFATPSSELVGFYENTKDFLTNLMKQHRQNPTILKDKFETIHKFYRINQSKSYERCVEVAAYLFQDVFNHQICNLLAAFPIESIVESTQKPFWSGLKKPPTPLSLDLNDPVHVEFIQSGANILATMFNIPMVTDKNVVISIVKQIKLPEYVPKKVHIEVDEKAEKKPEIVTEDDEKDVKSLFQILSGISVDKSHVSKVVEFQKDDPTNFHIQFMGGVSNLRARNYKIEEVDNFKVKLIAGKIIPAIATTTAMVVGVVGIEIIKYLVAGNKASFKNSSINLALPLWVFSDPIEAILNEDKEYDPIMCGPIRVIPGKFTKWEKINVKGPMTVLEMKDHFQKTYGIQVSMITYGTATVYSSYGAESKKRLDMQIPVAIESVCKKELPKWRKFIGIGVNGNTLDQIDCLLPDVRYQVY